VENTCQNCGGELIPYMEAFLICTDCGNLHDHDGSEL